MFNKCPRWSSSLPRIKIWWFRVGFLLFGGCICKFFSQSSLPVSYCFLIESAISLCLRIWVLQFQLLSMVNWNEMDPWTKMRPWAALSGELLFRCRDWQPLLGTETQQKAGTFTWLKTNFLAPKVKLKYVFTWMIDRDSNTLLDIELEISLQKTHWHGLNKKKKEI